MSTDTLSIDARDLGYSFTADPDFRLPERPRYIREAVMLPYGPQALLFDGVNGIQVLTGRSARGFVSQLIEQLDGRRTLAELCAAFPQVPPQAIRDAIILLYSRGLVEDGEPAEPAPMHAALGAFLGRYVDVTRQNANRDEALARFAATRVAVPASMEGGMLAETLDAYPFASVLRLTSPECLATASVDLFIGFFSGDAPDARAWFAAAHAAGIRALHAHVGSDKVEVGPYIMPGITGCYDCLRALHIAPTGTDAADTLFWAGVIAQRVGQLVARLGPFKLYNNVHVHERQGAEPTYRRYTLARLPGCSACGLGHVAPLPPGPELRTWLHHHASHIMTCKELRSPRDHQLHYAASNLQLTRKRPQPRYGVRTLALDLSLPVALPAWGQRGVPAPRADASLLSQMLWAAAGYQHTDQGLRRVAPSGGGLGSADLYVIARRVDGVPAGAWHYFGYGHLLEWIGPVDDMKLAGALGVPVADLPPLTIVGVSDMRKTRQKYDEFSFRIGTLDGGVARQFMQEVADVAGLAVTDLVDVRDVVLADLLNLAISGNRNMLVFVAGVGDAWAPGEPRDPLSHHSQVADSLIAMCATAGPGRVRSPVPAVPEVLPRVMRGLGELMRLRRSQRWFDARPLAASAIRSIAAVTMDVARCRNACSGLSLRLTLWVVVVRGEDECPAAVYRVDAAGGWHHHRAGPSRDELLSLMQQHSYAEAPVSLFVTGDLEHAMAAHGPRGYRELCVRAGSMLARAQLAAQCWEAVGSLWGGVAEEGLGRLFGIDRYTECPLFAASFGYASHE